MSGTILQPLQGCIGWSAVSVAVNGVAVTTYRMAVTTNDVVMARHLRSGQGVAFRASVRTQIITIDGGCEAVGGCASHIVLARHHPASEVG